MIGPPGDMAETPGPLWGMRMNVASGIAVGVTDPLVT